MKNERNLNFDFMKIISMLFVILWHIIVYGRVLSNCRNQALRLILDICTYFIVVHANSFVLLTGYYQSKKKCQIKKVIKLFFQVVFYSVVILLLGIQFGFVKEYNIVTFINNINLNSLNNYWFIKVYLILYLFSDFINKFIERLTKEEYKNFLTLGFILFSIIPFITGYKVFENNGYSIINFFYLYTLGGYFRKYPLKESYHFKNMTLNGYRILLIFGFFFLGLSNFFVNHLALEAKGMSNFLTDISSTILSSRLHFGTPFVILQTLLYFEFFKTLSIKQKFFYQVSKWILGVYLIHDNIIIREHIYKILKIDQGIFYDYQMILRIICCVFLIFVVCILIDSIRYGICKLLEKISILKKVTLKIKDFVNSFHFQVKVD